MSKGLPVTGSGRATATPSPSGGRVTSIEMVRDHRLRAGHGAPGQRRSPRPAADDPPDPTALRSPHRTAPMWDTPPSPRSGRRAGHAAGGIPGHGEDPRSASRVVATRA